MSVVRMLYICLVLFLTRQRFDVVISDQVSATNLGVYVLRLAREKTVFYCHYPDLLLCTSRESWWRRGYRKPFDWIEEVTTGMCDVLLVNSEFTADQLRKTFPCLRKRVQVLYPPIDTNGKKPPPGSMPSGLMTRSYFFSLNRFERKKDLHLAVEQFAKLQKPNLHLVIAGGFDSRLAENEEVFESLNRQVADLDLQGKVHFMKNISETQRLDLITHAIAVIYTPQWEHFGIVPIEAMMAGTPVIAWNNGGPRETIVDKQTGYLCGSRDEFARAMTTVLNLKPEQISKMSKACKQRVKNVFSLSSFTDSLVRKVINSTK